MAETENATYSTPTQGSNQSPIPTSFTFTLGLALIVVAGLSSGQFVHIWDAIWSGDIQKGVGQDARVLGGELLLIFVLSFLAETGSDANHVVIAFLFALWFGWFVFNGPTVVKWSKKLTGV